MKYIQLETLEDRLLNKACGLVDDYHQVSTIIIKANTLLKFFRHFNPQNVDPIQAEITGQVAYQQEDLEINLNWRIPNAKYFGPQGILTDNQVPILESINLYIDNQPLRVLQDNNKIHDNQVQKLLLNIFSEQIQSWKTIPELLIDGCQPSHLQNYNTLDIENIPSLNQIRIKRILKGAEPKQLFSYYNNASIENNIAYMRGFTSFQISDQPHFISLHWLIRASLKHEKPISPELALIETSTVPGAIFTGFTLSDVNGNPMSGEKEISSSIQILKLDSDWGNRAIQLFLNWLNKKTNLAKNTTNEISDSPEANFSFDFDENNDSFDKEKQENLQKIASNKIHQDTLFPKNADTLPSNQQPPFLLLHISPTNQPEYIFEGQLIASQSLPSSQSNYNNTKECQLFQHKNGGWVCVIKTYNKLTNDLTHCDMQKCDNTHEIKNFFGNNEVTETLLQQINRTNT